jgi:hypothetical protein
VRRGRAAWAGVAASIGGVLLFVYTVRQAGIDEIGDGIRRVGWWFLVILLLSAVRESARALAWMSCVEGPERLRFLDAIAARQAGEAVGNLTPLSLIASEPVKALYVRSRVPVMTALAATTAENIFYSFTVIAMISLGAVALLATERLPDDLNTLSRWGLAVLGCLAVTGIWILRARPRVASRIAGWVSAAGVGPRRLAQIEALEDRIYGFFARNRGRLLPLALLEALFHAAGVAEAYVTLALVSPGRVPTWQDAFVVEAGNRFIIVIFKMVPLRLGVEEAGTSLITNALGFGPQAGVTIGIVRKARILVWTAIGLGLLIRRGLSPRRAIAEAETLGASVEPRNP